MVGLGSRKIRQRRITGQADNDEPKVGIRPRRPSPRSALSGLPTNPRFLVFSYTERYQPFPTPSVGTMDTSSKETFLIARMKNFSLSRRWGSNPRPMVYETIALPAELLRHRLAVALAKLAFALMSFGGAQADTPIHSLASEAITNESKASVRQHYSVKEIYHNKDSLQALLR